MKTGIEYIENERNKVLLKRSIENDIEINKYGQLSQTAELLSREDINVNVLRLNRPSGWDKAHWIDLISRPYMERLIIAGQLYQAEIDRCRAMVQKTAITIDSLLLTEDYETCENCENVFKSDDMHYDGEGCYFCEECFTALAPVWKAEHEEMVKNGEIEEGELCD